VKLDPRHLILFATLVEEGSFSRAAQTLGMAQPAVSKTVAALEARLGQSLLLRRRPIEPTETGRVLAAIGFQLRTLTEDASQKADMIKHGKLGRLRVGAPPFFCEDVLAQLVLKFHRKNPQVSFELETAYAPELRDRVFERKLDIALVPMVTGSAADGIPESHLMDVTHAIVARQEYDLPDQTGLKEFLDKALWLDHAGESILQSYAINALTRMGVTRRESFSSVKSGNALFNMLLSIDSLAVLPIVTVLPHLRSRQLKIVAIPAEMPIVPFGLITHSSIESTPLMNSFRSLVETAFKDLADEASAVALMNSGKPGLD
jgi:DNA-binding transcriptional LysR family regulator